MKLWYNRKNESWTTKPCPHSVHAQSSMLKTIRQCLCSLPEICRPYTPKETTHDYDMDARDNCEYSQIDIGRKCAKHYFIVSTTYMSPSPDIYCHRQILVRQLALHDTRIMHLIQKKWTVSQHTRKTSKVGNVRHPLPPVNKKKIYQFGLMAYTFISKL